MHPQLEILINQQGMLTKRSVKTWAKYIDPILDPDEPILDTLVGGKALQVLTPSALIYTNGFKTKALKLSAITSVELKATKAKIETSTDEIKLSPALGFLGASDYKSLAPFVGSIQKAMRKLG